MTDTQGDCITTDAAIDTTPPPLSPFRCRHCLCVLARLTVADGKTALTEIHQRAVVTTGKNSIILHCPECGTVRPFVSVDL
jgi:phage FluMu protein Com